MLSGLTPFERIRYNSYCTLYQNVLTRLCTRRIVVGTDFFTDKHSNVDAYKDKGTAVVYGGYTYLVVGRDDRVVLLLPPLVALVRNLPKLAVWERGYFRPSLEEVSSYWNKWIEPTEVVLFKAL